MAGLLESILMMLLIPLGMAALGLLGWAVRLLNSRRRKSTAEQPSSRCSRGYELTKLDRIRCPECGRVFGFDATPEELGLSDEELRRATEARERRKSGSLSPVAGGEGWGEGVAARPTAATRDPRATTPSPPPSPPTMGERE